ncbi:hypothetical protein BJ170DRAFT_639991 [Xylariales sp. AK1849]|nr:hypothetical protein BJ170DRAFT_639991 [Xylariales sp. AK1849]
MYRISWIVPTTSITTLLHGERTIQAHLVITMGQYQTIMRVGVPARQQEALASRQRVPLVTTEDNADRPNPPATFSKLNTGICEVTIDGDQMCGVVFSSPSSLRRHIRQYHPGAIANANPRTPSNLEIIACRNAIKRRVLLGHWRDSRYVNDPGMGPEQGLLRLYAEKLETIAASNPEFAAKHGRLFHRRGCVEMGVSKDHLQPQSQRVRADKSAGPIGLSSSPASEAKQRIQQSGKKGSQRNGEPRRNPKRMAVKREAIETDSDAEGPQPVRVKSEIIELSSDEEK